MTETAALLMLGLLLLSGCSASTDQVAKPTDSGDKKTAPSPEQIGSTQVNSVQKVTLHVPEMNKRLKIMGDDGPNPVKQALAELDGVESVNDEWTLEGDWTEDLDVLFVTYDTRLVSVDTLIETIKQLGYESTVQN